MFRNNLSVTDTTHFDALGATGGQAGTASETAPAFTRAPVDGAVTAGITRTTRAVQVGTRKAPITVRYDIDSIGSVGARDALFPEDKPALSHQPIDEPAYLSAVDRLAPEQRQALRAWAAIDDVTDVRYHDDTPVVEDGLSYALNEALSAGRLTPSLQTAARHLDAGLAAMPRFPARLTRVAEHGPSHPSPWSSSIGVGDIVTPGPRFMSASDNHRYARDNLSSGRVSGSCLGDDTDTLAFYLLDASSGVPLLKGSLAANGEREWMFRPGAAFRVSGIASATPHVDTVRAAATSAATGGADVSDMDTDDDGDDDGPLARRVGVHLEELVGYEGPAKNLFTGEPIDVRRDLRGA